MNPLDRNHDGKVDLKDLSARQGQNNILAPGMTQTTTSTTTAAGPIGHNPLDRNHDGRVDARDFNNQQGLNNQGLAGAHHNPLDRNHDGRVDARDFTNQTGAHHNPLDRNHDGRVDARDFAGQQSGLVGQTTYVQSSQRASIGQIRAEPTIVEHIQKDVVVHEHIHPVQKEEIQPVIYREREQLDVKQVTQMMHETQIQPTLVQQRELPAEHRAAVIERGAAIQENYVAPSREVDATLRTQVVHAPIVNEVIKKTIIEEIQPVLERDIITSTVIQNTQPIYEKIVEAPHVYRETVVVHQERGIVGGDLAALEAQGFNLGTAGRRLSQGYSHNPLDRNHDGRVDARDFNNQGLSGAHHNPLDRNHDGRVDARDFTNQGMNNQGLAGDSLLGHRGLVGANQTGNSLDRNHDGRVDARDFNNQQGLNNQGLAGAHHNPLDRNHDGKVDLKDLSGRQNTATANRPVNLL